MATKKTKNDKWQTRWSVASFSDPDKKYTVAKDFQGNFGCSCPAWIFKHKKQGHHCKHISAIIHATDKVLAATLISHQKMEAITLSDWTIRVLDDLSAPAEKAMYIPLTIQHAFGGDYDE